MCGCFASFNINQADIFKKLEQLFYRGKNGVGIGFFHRNGKIYLCKTVADDVWNDRWITPLFDGNKLLAHCRWPSTSKVSIDNTHPILSFNEEILAIHNGTIENAEDIRKQLQVGKQ